MNSIKKRIYYIFQIMAIAVCSVWGSVTVAADDSEAETNVPESIVVEATAEYPAPPEISAYAGILIDVDTGAIIYEKNIHEKLYPASITKIMTAFLAIENLALEDTYTFTSEVLNSLPWDAAKYGYVAGEEVSIKDLINVLIIRSANEVAIGLANLISGSEEAFGELMTKRAKEMGALNTSFTNASGLHQDSHYTTAYDMAMIAIAASKNATFADIWGKSTYVVAPTNKNDSEATIWNRHDMLVKTRANYYQYAIGGKTGYTDEAGRTLVTYASKDGMNLMCVVMKSSPTEYFTDTRALFEYGFNNFEKVSVSGNESRFGQSEEGYFISRDNLFNQSGALLTVGNDYVTIPKDSQLSQIGYELIYNQSGKNNVVADIKYTAGGHYLGKTSIILNVDGSGDTDVSPYKKEEVKKQEERSQLTINIWWVTGILSGLLVIFIVIKILKKTSKKRKAKRERKKLFKHNKLH